VTDRIMQVFLNIVLDEAVEEKEGGEKVRLGMIVRLTHLQQPDVMLTGLLRLSVETR
jgi:hypothetical protein